MLGCIVVALRALLSSRRGLIRRLIQTLRLERAKVARYRAIEVDVDNQLVGVKHVLWMNINSGDVERIRFVFKYLQISQSLWISLSYGYKGHELCNGMIRELDRLLKESAPQAYKRRGDIGQLMRQSYKLGDLFYAKHQTYMREVRA